MSSRPVGWAGRRAYRRRRRAGVAFAQRRGEARAAGIASGGRNLTRPTPDTTLRRPPEDAGHARPVVYTLQSRTPPRHATGPLFRLPLRDSDRGALLELQPAQLYSSGPSFGRMPRRARRRFEGVTPSFGASLRARLRRICNTASPDGTRVSHRHHESGRNWCPGRLHEGWSNLRGGRRVEREGVSVLDRPESS